MMNKKVNVSDKKLILFFVITLLWTWICGFTPVILGITGTPLGTFIFYFGGGAPSVVALFLVAFTYSKEARRDYFYRCFSFKYMGWKWPLWIIFYFGAITVFGLLIGTKLLNLNMPGMDYIQAVMKAPYMILIVIFLSLISGPLNEEFGWRGYALDKLLVRFGFLGASLLLGFIWGIWHLAWYFTPGQAQYDMLQKSVFDAAMFIPSIMLLNIVVTFVYIKTKRSILAGALVHMFGNLINSQMLSPYTEDMGMCIRYIKMLFCIVIMIYAIRSKSFKEEVKNQIAEMQLYEMR